MKMNFDFDNVNALANALGSRIQLLEELIDSNGLSPEQVQVIGESDFRKDFIPVYGFHIDSNESDPSEAVTYLADAVGMKPAFMDYSKGEFNYGSWEDAFFMPRPCMLKYDGTVDYYLDPNDYSKKENGTDSDVDDFEYGGNAMMEWGRNGRQIWYKIVPDEDDNTSASIYFCEYKLDEGYHAWSFINNQGVLVDHFYTPIYNGTIDGDGKLRSISDKSIDMTKLEKSFSYLLNIAELNNQDENKLWNIEVYSDIVLINLLLVLIGKCLDTQLVFGNGNLIYGYNSILLTGSMNDKGLFSGANDNTHGVKVFGMENYWGNLARFMTGILAFGKTVKYKLTRDTNDGSEAADYNFTGEGYKNLITLFEQSSDIAIYGYVTKCIFSEDGAICFKEFSGNDKTYYADQGTIVLTSEYGDPKFAMHGGGNNVGNACGAFYISLSFLPSTTKSFLTSASLSCKPLAQSN